MLLERIGGHFLFKPQDFHPDYIAVCVLFVCLFVILNETLRLCAGSQFAFHPRAFCSGRQNITQIPACSFLASAVVLENVCVVRGSIIVEAGVLPVGCDYSFSTVNIPENFCLERCCINSAASFIIDESMPITVSTISSSINVKALCLNTRIMHSLLKAGDVNVIDVDEISVGG